MAIDDAFGLMPQGLPCVSPIMVDHRVKKIPVTIRWDYCTHPPVRGLYCMQSPSCRLRNQPPMMSLSCNPHAPILSCSSLYVGPICSRVAGSPRAPHRLLWLGADRTCVAENGCSSCCVRRFWCVAAFAPTVAGSSRKKARTADQLKNNRPMIILVPLPRQAWSLLVLGRIRWLMEFRSIT